ncbi:hypothetical protein KGM_207198 [Danaus plexippus plexippus]|uniref:Uncharacterized protein n=1 Tax=Danaus plexippus plexippus TaxID=278856 RepID=A0A212FDX6_DANPL|nr:hypothetical protein KGM_207198 [Danaus plexippus plexippus]
MEDKRNVQEKKKRIRKRKEKKNENGEQERKKTIKENTKRTEKSKMKQKHRIIKKKDETLKQKRIKTELKKRSDKEKNQESQNKVKGRQNIRRGLRSEVKGKANVNGEKTETEKQKEKGKGEAKANTKVKKEKVEKLKKAKVEKLKKDQDQCLKPKRNQKKNEEENITNKKENVIQKRKENANKYIRKEGMSKKVKKIRNGIEKKSSIVKVEIDEPKKQNKIKKQKEKREPLLQKVPEVPTVTKIQKKVQLLHERESIKRLYWKKDKNDVQVQNTADQNSDYLNQRSSNIISNLLEPQPSTSAASVQSSNVSRIFKSKDRNTKYTYNHEFVSKKRANKDKKEPSPVFSVEYELNNFLNAKDSVLIDEAALFKKFVDDENFEQNLALLESQNIDNFSSQGETPNQRQREPLDVYEFQSD